MFVQISERGSADLEKRLQALEKRAGTTEKKLSGVGSGMEAGAKRGQTALGRLQDELDDTGKKADAVSKKSVTLKTSLTGNKQVEAGLDAINRRQENIDGSTVTLKTTLSGSRDVLSELSQIDGATTKVDGDTVTVTAKVKGGEEGKAQIAALDAAASKIDGDQLTMTAEVKGTASAVSELAALNSVASTVDGRNVRLNVDRSSVSALDVLGNSLTSVATRLRALATVGQTAVLPGLIAGIGGLIPVVSAAGVAVAGLASGIGQGLAGAAVSGASAAGLLGGALAAVIAPLKMVLGNIEEYKTGLDGAKSAQQSAATASQAYADAQRGVADAQANVARVSADAGRAIKEAEQGVADARREGASSIADAERNLAQTRQDAASSIADAERGLQDARRSAAEGIADAEDDLTDARVELELATYNVTQAQQELNSAMREEPLNQEQATLDLAEARDRVGDATRDYNEAVKEYGQNSEEASDASRNLQQAELDLARQTADTADIRKNGSEELRAAEGAWADSVRSQTDAVQGVQDAEQGLADARSEGARTVADAQRQLSAAQSDAARSVSEGQRAVTEARRSSAQQIADAEKGLADTRRDAAQQVADAQKAVADAQRAAATAAKAAATAQSAADQKTVKLTASQMALLKAWEAFAARADSTFRPAQDAVARLGVEVLKLASGYLPQLAKASLASVNALSRSFTGFKADLAGPVEQAGISRFLAALPRVTQTAATAAGKLGLALFNVFARSIPYGEKLINGFARLTTQFHAFTRSAEGASAIDRFLASTFARAEQLGRAIVNLGHGFMGLFAAIDRSGVTDQVFGGFVRLTDQFRRFTAEGSKGAAAIQRFGAASRPVLTAVWGVIKTLVSEWFRVSSAIMRMRNESGKLVLPQALGDMRSALRSIGDLLIAAFKNFGPLIGPAIKGIAELLKYYIALNPVLQGAARLFVRILTAFSRLDHDTKQAIVSLVSMRIAFAVIGPVIAALFSPLTRVAGAVLGISKATGPVGKALAKMGGWFGRIAAGIAARGGLLGVLRIAAAFLLGPWGLAIAAAVAAGVLIYRNWDRIKKAAGPLVASFKQIAQQGLKFLQAQAQRLVNWWKSTWPQIQKTGSQVLQALGRAIRSAAGPALKFFQKQAQLVVNWFRKNWPLIQKTASTVFNALKKVTSTAFNIVKKVITTQMKAIASVVKAVFGSIVRFWKANHTEITNILKAAWNTIKTIVSTVIKVVLGIIKATMQAITGDWKGAWNTIKNVLQTTWDAIKQLVKNSLTIVKNLIKIAWDVVKSLTSAAWEAVKTSIGDKIQAANERVKTVLGWLKNGLKSAWDAIKQLTSAAWDAVKNYIGDKIQAANQRVKQVIGWLRAGLKSAWEKMRSEAASGWEAIVSAVREKAEAVIGIVNAVLKAFGQPTISLGGDSKTPPAEKTGPSGTGGTGSPMRARGGVYGPDGKLVRRMARGGVVPQDAVGGVVRGVMPHAVYGEAGSEAYVRLDKKTPESANALYTANEEWAKRGWLPNPEHHKEGAGMMARGGLLDTFKRAGILFAPHGATAWENLWNPRTAQIARETEDATGARPNTYYGHPDGFGERAPYSIDWWGSSGRGDAVGVGLGDKVLQHITDKYASEISYWMWNAKASSDALNAAISADPHGDHVHGTFKPGLNMMSGGAGGGGVSGPSLADQIWTGEGGSPPEGWKGAVVSGLLSALPGAGLVGLAAKAFPGLEKLLPDSLGQLGEGVVGSAITSFVGEGAKDWVKDWVYSKFGSSGGSGTTPSGGGGSADANRALAEKMLASSSTGGSWSSLLELWNRESQFNELADNPSSSAYGIPQAMTSLHDLPQGYGPPGGDPGAQIGWGLNYIGDKYGTTDAALRYHDANNSYAKGGITEGKAKLEMPSPVSRAFKTVADALNRMVGGNENGMLKETGRGQVVDRITGIAGEAGPESIVPLKRKTPEGENALRTAMKIHHPEIKMFATGGISGLVEQGRGAWDGLVDSGADGFWRFGPLNPGTLAVTGPLGTTLNQAVWGQMTDNARTAVINHEWGHRGGFMGHLATGNLMQPSFLSRGTSNPAIPTAADRNALGGATGLDPDKPPVGTMGESGGSPPENTSGGISQTQTGSGRQVSIQTSGGVAAGPKGGAMLKRMGMPSGGFSRMPGLEGLANRLDNIERAVRKPIEIGEKSIGKQAGANYETARGYGGSRENFDNVQGIVKAAARQAVGTGRR